MVAQEKFHYLNNLLHVTGENTSLTYYLGWTYEKLLGPLSQMIAAITLGVLSLAYTKNITCKSFILIIFTFLLVLKWEVLFFPPYGDAIGGPFAEAIWLYQNNFNYAQLVQQPDYALGGPRVYVFSVYPTYLALWMKLISSPVILMIVLHSFVFLMIAAVVSLLREVFKTCFLNDVATLASILFLFTPLVQSQSESLNMEVPCLFFLYYYQLIF